MNGCFIKPDVLYVNDYILDRMINNKNTSLPIGIVINSLPLPLELKQLVVNNLVNDIDIYNNSNPEFWYILGIENSSIKYHIKMAYSIIANSFSISHSLSKLFHNLIEKISIVSHIMDGLLPSYMYFGNNININGRTIKPTTIFYPYSSNNLYYQRRIDKEPLNYAQKYIDYYNINHRYIKTITLDDKNYILNTFRRLDNYITYLRNNSHFTISKGFILEINDTINQLKIIDRIPIDSPILLPKSKIARAIKEHLLFMHTMIDRETSYDKIKYKQLILQMVYLIPEYNKLISIDDISNLSTHNCHNWDIYFYHIISKKLNLLTSNNKTKFTNKYIQNVSSILINS